MDTQFTDEQWAQILRLEAIFMPQSRRQRLQAGFTDDRDGPPIPFVHYTSADAALKIISSKRLWMRNSTSMVDYREVDHGISELGRFFADSARESDFMSALDASHPGVAKEAITFFAQRLDEVRLNTNVASISEHDSRENEHGRLSMWPAFGGSARVAIVLKVPHLSGGALALNLLFSPVAYLTENEVAAVLSEVRANAAREVSYLRGINRDVMFQMLFRTFLAAAVSLKHEGFREEREWRAVYSPTFHPSPLMEAGIEVVNGVPQNIYKIPLDGRVDPLLAGLDFVTLFDRMIIGPSSYPWVMFEAFSKALSDAGIDNAGERVVTSGIPLRS